MTATSPQGDPMAQAALRAADACVKCGACLPVCPTYARSRHEGDSPRGRVTLVQGLLADRLRPDAALAFHLDGCLQCRFCERVCPAQVQVVAVVRAGRADLRDAGVPASWAAFRALVAGYRRPPAGSPAAPRRRDSDASPP